MSRHKVTVTAATFALVLLILFFFFRQQVPEMHKEEAANQNDEQILEVETSRILGIETPVITNKEQLSVNIGRMVTLRGVVSTSKIPRVLGVKVNSIDEHRGRYCEVKGMLVGMKIDTDLKQDEHATDIPRNVGTIVRYSIYSNLNGQLSSTRIFETNLEERTMSKPDLDE